jgi:hypothetical protein
VRARHPGLGSVLHLLRRRSLTRRTDRHQES